MADPGPVVDLNLGPQAQTSPSPSANPLGLAGGLASLQSQLQQNQLFRQQWSARQQAGDILASSPDLPSAIKRMQATPDVMGWFPEITTQLIQNQIGNQSLAKLKLETSQSALGAVYSALAPTQSDPSLYDKSMKLATSSLSPEVRVQVGPVLDNINSILSPLAKSDPDTYRRTLAAMQLATLSPDKVYGMSGNAPPQVNVSAGGGAGTVGGLPNQRPIIQPPTQPSSSSQGYTGASLAPDPKDFLKSRFDSNGLPIRGITEQGQVNAASAKFASDQPTYEASSQTIAAMESAQDEIQTLAKGNTFLTPGALGNLRAAIAKGVNTLYTLSGKEPPVDITKAGTAEALIKGTQTNVFQLAHNMMGTHAGIGALQEAQSAIPGIENSPFGGMLVSETLKAAAAWKRDEGIFVQNWANANGGDIRNAEQTFRTQNPPSSYIQKVMTQYGLGPKGFTSKEAIGEQLSAHLISEDMARAAYRKLKGASQ